jgi:hypothetical protein
MHKASYRKLLRPEKRAMDEIDIFRSAKLLIDQHGADAPIHAAMRVDALIETGDVDGVSVWKRVLRAIGELQATKGETRH